MSSITRRLRAATTSRRRVVRALAVVGIAFALALGIGIPANVQSGGPQGAPPPIAAQVASKIGLGVEGAAAHDTWACNYWIPTGYYCGKVRVMSNSRAGVFITDHDGNSNYLPPGYYSRGSRWMRDVARVIAHPGYCMEVYLDTWGPGMYYFGLFRSFYPEDNGEDVVVKVRYC